MRMVRGLPKRVVGLAIFHIPNLTLTQPGVGCRRQKVNKKIMG
jgi:hypothetical protein